MHARVLIHSGKSRLERQKQAGKAKAGWKDIHIQRFIDAVYFYTPVFNEFTINYQ
jgi:hypothetical protein